MPLYFSLNRATLKITLIFGCNIFFGVSIPARSSKFKISRHATWEVITSQPERIFNPYENAMFIDQKGCQERHLRLRIHKLIVAGADMKWVSPRQLHQVTINVIYRLQLWSKVICLVI